MESWFVVYRTFFDLFLRLFFLSLLCCAGRRSVGCYSSTSLTTSPFYIYIVSPLSFIFHLSPCAFTMALVDFLMFFFFGLSCGYGGGYTGCGNCGSCTML